ncbi:MAG: hypothetical protein HY900_12860, partial [Deltaproteobacteria bacterium]|nr:hypothetical protein [Deltaproteobacteria bacterium]
MMRAGDELRAVLGLALLAAGAWWLPGLRTALFPPRPAPPTAVYALSSEPRLFWSPAGEAGVPPRAEGRVLGPAGTLLRPIG